MGEALVITSGKGGVGKTTTTANIGTALALFGKKVCLVDADIGLRNLDFVLGAENRIIYDLVDVIEGRCDVDKALVAVKHSDDSLQLLPASQSRNKLKITPEQMKGIITQLKQDFDYVIIDCPAGIEQGFENAIAGADKAIVVTTPEKVAVRDADSVIGILKKEEHIEEPKLVINRIRGNMVKNGDMMDIDEVIRILDIQLIGTVVDDDQVIKGSHLGIPIVHNSSNEASISYRNIARRILGETIPLQKIGTQSTGVFSKIKKLFGVK